MIKKTSFSGINFAIPDKKWPGKSLGYIYLRIFGVFVFLIQMSESLYEGPKRLGYPSGVKGYKIWLLEEKKCMISWNMFFQESVVHKDVVQ